MGSQLPDGGQGGHRQARSRPARQQVDQGGHRQRHQQQKTPRQHIAQPAQAQRGQAPPGGPLRGWLVAPPQLRQRRLQFNKHPGSARDQHQKPHHRGQPPFRRLLRAGHGLTHHIGHLLTHDGLHLGNEVALQVAAVHPPTHHPHQQQKQGRQAEHAVERHCSAHAQPVGLQPERGGAPEGLQQLPHRLHKMQCAGFQGVFGHGQSLRGAGGTVHPPSAAMRVGALPPAHAPPIRCRHLLYVLRL